MRFKVDRFNFLNPAFVFLFSFSCVAHCSVWSFYHHWS